MIIVILLTFITPLAIFILFDLLTNNSTGTLNSLQLLAAHPEWWGDALMGILLTVIISVLFVVSQVILFPFYMRGGKWADKK